jgi:hypothetical protein
VRRTANDAWFVAVPGTQALVDMSNTLHRGSLDDLNIYT